MTKEEFILHSARLGYSNKKQGEKWCENHPKDNYTEEDFEDLFRWVEACREKNNSGVWHSICGVKTTKCYKHTYDV